MKIRKEDNVLIMTGKDKGKTGKVLKVFNKSNRVIVEGINIVTKHLKKMGTNPGQIIKKENPIDVSNIMLVCPYTGKPTRIGYVFITEKTITKKFRYSKKALKQKGGEAKDFIIK